MISIDSPTTTWALYSLLASGLLFAWTARVSIGTRHQGLFQLLFLGVFAGVGGLAVFAPTLGPTWHCWSGGVLCAMALAAVWDLRGPHSARMVAERG